MSDEIRLDLKKRNIFFVVAAAMLIVLILPTLIRFYSGNDSLIGSESYYHFRAARELLRDGSLNMFSPPQDIPDMSYSPRNYVFNPYHYILVYTSSVVSLATASRIVPLLLGILSVFLFNLILKGFIEEAYKRHIVLLLFVLNPAFIYTFTVSNPHAAAIALSLFGLFLFLRPERISLVLSAVCFVGVSLFSLFNALLVIALLLAFLLSEKRFLGRFVVITLLVALFSLAGRASFFYNYAFDPGANIFSNLFSDLGGLIGFGIFSIVLAVYGTTANWRPKSSFMHFFFLALLLIAAILFVGSVSNMYFAFFVAVAAGFGFIRLYELQWSAPVLKNLALLIIICGVIFSTASYITRLGSLEPSREMVESLDWLGSNTFKDGFVLSHFDKGYMISAISRNPVLADSLATSSYDQKFFYKVQDSMFYGRKLVDTKQLLDAYNIRYIYVTPLMKSGKIWRKDNEGLLFLFTNDKTFSKIYYKDGFEVWEVIRQQDSSGK